MSDEPCEHGITGPCRICCLVEREVLAAKEDHDTIATLRQRLSEAEAERDEAVRVCRVFNVDWWIGRGPDALSHAPSPSAGPARLRDRQSLRDVFWKFGREFRDLSDDKAYVTMINEALDAIEFHLAARTALQSPAQQIRARDMDGFEPPSANQRDPSKST